MKLRTVTILIILGILPFMVLAKGGPMQKPASASLHKVFDNIANEDYVCLKKAEFGQHLAAKKIKGVPLEDILAKIEYAEQALKGHKGKVISPSTFREMESMAKEVYRQSYESDVDVQTYVEYLYQTCIKRHI